MLRKKTTLADIARRVGVSPAVVGCVLLKTGAGVIRVGEETARKIEKVARELDYRPNRSAQQLAGKQSQAIGLVLDAQAAPVIQQRRVAAIERIAALHGYRVIVGRTSGERATSVHDYLADFISDGVEGVVVIDHHPWERKMLHDVVRRFGKEPLVVQSQEPFPRGTNQVSLNIGQGSIDAVDYLVTRGHRRLGLALIEGLPSAQIRRENFFAALKRHGLPAKESGVWMTGNASNKLTAPEIDGLINRLVGTHGATALVLENDYWALQMVVELARRQVAVPKAVAVIGYNNLDFTALVSPSITTFDENEQAVAEAIFALLLGRIQRRARADKECLLTVAPMLIARDSA